MNDPSFAFDKGSPSSFDNREKTTAVRGQIITNKMKLTQGKPAKCLLNETDNLTRSDCRTFNGKPISERKSFVRQNGLCFRCCNGKHSAQECLKHVLCSISNSNKHCTSMHEERNTKFAQSGKDGAVRSLKPNDDFLQATNVRTSCTQVCGHERFRGKSCAKTVLVKIHPEHNPERNLKAYVLIDDQSNRLLARSEFFDYFGENTQEIEYMLSSCSGHISTTGRQTSWYVIESLD